MLFLSLFSVIHSPFNPETAEDSQPPSVPMEVASPIEVAEEDAVDRFIASLALEQHKRSSTEAAEAEATPVEEALPIEEAASPIECHAMKEVGVVEEGEELDDITDIKICEKLLVEEQGRVGEAQKQLEFEQKSVWVAQKRLQLEQRKLWGAKKRLEAEQRRVGKLKYNLEAERIRVKEMKKRAVIKYRGKFHRLYMGKS